MTDFDPSVVANLMKAGIDKVSKSLKEDIPDNPEYALKLTSHPFVITDEKELRKVAKEVPEDEFGTEDFQRFCVQLNYILMATGVAALAAPFVGVDKRIISVMDIKTGRVSSMTNPVITPTSDRIFGMKEGSILITDYYATVRRNADISVTYTDYRGEEQTVELTDHNASIVQHEVDVLDGIMFTDKVSKFADQLATEKMNKRK